jgi:DNA-binding HxlR family transcriptional regulator
MKTLRRSSCPVSCVLDLVGDRWTLLIVRDLMLGKRRFDEFLQSAESIATNILSDRLQFLCDQGFIWKETDPTDRRRFRYALSPKGESLTRLVGELARWGLVHIPKTCLAKEALPYFKALNLGSAPHRRYRVR